MSVLNHPDKVSLSAFADPQLQSRNGNGVYNQFTNTLQTPILNAKSIQLLNANFINSRLQLDDNTQLMFWYRTLTGTTPALQCIRLLPSNFVPLNPTYTTFTRNRYFNTVDELVAALNIAASVGGDDPAFNPFFIGGQITFSYDANQRKISFVTTSGVLVGPTPADSPAVLAAMSSNTILMNSRSGSVIQPAVPGITMNASLGFPRSFNSRPIWPTSLSSPLISSSTGLFSAFPIEATANPILLGTQNISIYCSIVTGSGIDNSGRKNLLQTIPIEVAPLNINNYTCNSVKAPAMSVPPEIYEINIQFLDDRGQPFMQPPNYNSQLSLAVFY